MTKLFPNRGSNPNSHGNNRKSPVDNLIRKTIGLKNQDWKLVDKLGNGNRTKGIRKLMRIAIAAVRETLMSENMLITESGYIIDQCKIDRFRKLKKVEELREFLGKLDDMNLGQVAIAEGLVLDLLAAELALFRVVFSEDVGIRHLGYIVARADETLMFESAYFESCLGSPPYLLAVQFGLTEQEIKEYQQKWRELGIEPTKIYWENLNYG